MHKPTRVLIIEDNPVISHIVAQIMMRRGYRPQCASDGLQALNILEEYQPDIIFVDLLLPKIDGETLCYIIRRKHQFHNSHIVILSGIVAEADLDIVKIGADACIAKGRQMSEHINEVLDKIENGSLRAESVKSFGYEDIHSRDATVGLLNSKKHFETIITNLTDGIVEVADGGVMLYINPALEQILGKSKHNLIGQDFFRNFNSEDQAYARELLGKALVRPTELFESKTLQLNERFVVLKYCALENNASFTCLILLHDITESRELENKLRRLSRTDQLTGLFNRRAFDDFFTEEVVRVKRYNEPFAIVLIDVDDFKDLNDALGHNEGDHILQEIVSVLQEQTRETDFFCRWGGDEFLLILPRTGREGARIIAERMRATVENASFSVAKNITISLGVSVFQLGDDTKTLIQRADQALYQAKRAGRNRVSIYLKQNIN